jgi:uncharacterized protein
MAKNVRRLELRIDTATLDRLDRWCDEQADQPTRAEAIRRLINIGIDSIEPKRWGRKGEWVSPAKKVKRS